MKSTSHRASNKPMLSPPTREAWIEIFRFQYDFKGIYRRLPPGRRGLKFLWGSFRSSDWTSPPTREAWIEIGIAMRKSRLTGSPPTREAWIEMRFWRESAFSCKSPPTREAWIEISYCAWMERATLSPPTREAWIEIAARHERRGREVVASHPGGVD